MDPLKLKGSLNIAKGRLKQKWAKFTRDDFQLLEGKQDETIGQMQRRAAETRAAVVKANKKSGQKPAATAEKTADELR